MSREKQIEEMAECCPYFWNGACTVDAANPTDCDLMCEMFGFMTSLVNAGYRKQEWISVKDRLPQEFVSVLGYMTDAEGFPPVRECYMVGRVFFFPALRDVRPVSHWMPFPEPPKMKGGAE
jgi:hypothetical protein